MALLAAPCLGAREGRSVGQLPDGGVMEGMGLGAAGARGWGDGGHGPTPPGRIVSLGHKLGGAFEGEGEGE